jgi:hypothetical protein
MDESQEHSIHTSLISLNDANSEAHDKSANGSTFVSRTHEAQDRSPRALTPYSLSSLTALAAELVVCMMPVAFLILAGLASQLNGRPVTEYGEAIKQWTLLSPTLFPIVFAAVMGRSLHSIARYRLERGSQLRVSCSLSSSIFD